MKKFFLILSLISLTLSAQDIPAKRIRIDTAKVFSTNYGTLDTMWFKSRADFTRPVKFDSLVRFMTNFAVPLGSSYDTTRFIYKTVALDSFSTHNTYMHANRDSVNALRIFANANRDSIHRLTDSVFSHNLRINLVSQKISDSLLLYIKKADSTITAVNAPLTLLRSNHTTTVSADTSTRNLSFTTDNDRIRDSLQAVSAFAPMGRTLSINGSTQDLSANRTWSVGTIVANDTAISRLYTTALLNAKLNTADSAKAIAGYGWTPTYSGHSFTGVTDSSIFLNKAGTQDITGIKSFHNLQNFDSLSISGILNLGGATSDGSAAFYLKSLPNHVFGLHIFSPQGVDIFNVDTSGNTYSSTSIASSFGFFTNTISNNSDFGYVRVRTVPSSGTYGSATIDNYIGAYTSTYADVLEYAGKSTWQTSGGDLALVAVSAGKTVQVYTGGRTAGNKRATFDDLGLTLQGTLTSGIINGNTTHSTSSIPTYAGIGLTGTMTGTEIELSKTISNNSLYSHLFIVTVPSSGTYGSATIDNNIGAYTSTYSDVSEYAGKTAWQSVGGDIALISYSSGKEVQFYTGGRASGNKRMTIADATTTINTALALGTNAITSGAVTSSGLSDFGTNGGNGTIGAGDSVQVTVTGLTTATGVATVCYKRGITSSATADTIATYNITAADKLTLFGKYGYTISYSIMKK